MALSNDTINSLDLKVRSFLRIADEYGYETTRDLVREAVEQLQQFKGKTLVDTVTDAATETTLSKLDERFVCLYAAIHIDQRHDLQDAIDLIISRVRTQ